jgi:ribosome-binding factor A
MAKGYRKERLEREMLRQISEIITFKMKDPRVGMTTVTRVELSPDFAFAKVFVSHLGDKKAKENVVALLNKARGFVQSMLRKGLKIRQLPEIRFVLDKGLENVQQVERIFKSLEREEQGKEEE